MKQLDETKTVTRRLGGNLTEGIRILAFRGRSWTSRVIQWRTGGPYSHVALLPSMDYAAWRRYYPLCAPTVVEAWCGRVQHGDVCLAHTPGTPVEVWCMPATPAQITAVDVFCLQEIGKKYDYMALLGFVTSTMRVDQPDRWFCSELVAAALIQAALLPSAVEVPCRTDPNRLMVEVQAMRAYLDYDWVTQ